MTVEDFTVLASKIRSHTDFLYFHLMGEPTLHPHLKELLDGKTAYCLRHTFATICQQYVRPDIVDIWMGDSPTRLVGKVYTHFPDEFMLENMMKVEFPRE